MSRINQILEQLKPFSELKEVQSLLAQFNLLKEKKKTDDDDFIPLRKQLIKIKKEHSNKELKRAAHKSLLYLAKHSPINQTCFKTLHPIKNNKVVISTGHQFSLDELIKYHRSRPPRENERNNQKDILNPYINCPMDKLDVDHIQNKAKKHHINIEDKPPILHRLFFFWISPERLNHISEEIEKLLDRIPPNL